MSRLLKRAAETERNSELLKRDRTIARLEADCRIWKEKYSHAVKEIEAAERRNEFLDALNGSPDVEKWEREIKKRKSVATAMAVLSDWHTEERVDAETVNGLNSYNLQIAEKRIQRVFQKTVEYVNRYCPMAKELYLFLLGDFITGFIHEELVENNYLSPTEATLFVQDRLTAGIDFLLRELKIPIIAATSYGNHGRTTPKKRISTGHKNSYEWMLYKVLERQYSGNPRIKWKVGVGYHNLLEVYGRIVRLHHGDDLKYNGGVGGISIPVNKSIAQWNKSYTASLDVFGHWHQYIDSWYWVCNSSLIGYNAYALSIKAEPQDPTQTFILFDKRKGKRFSMPIFVD